MRKKGEEREKKSVFFSIPTKKKLLIVVKAGVVWKGKTPKRNYFFRHSQNSKKKIENWDVVENYFFIGWKCIFYWIDIFFHPNTLFLVLFFFGCLSLRPNFFFSWVFEIIFTSSDPQKLYYSFYYIIIA